MRKVLAVVVATAALGLSPAPASAQPACAGVTGRPVSTGPTCVFEYMSGSFVFWAQNTRAYEGGALREDRVTISLYNYTRGYGVGYCESIGYNAGCGGMRQPAGTTLPGDVIYCTVTSFLAVSTEYFCGY